MIDIYVYINIRNMYSDLQSGGLRERILHHSHILAQKWWMMIPKPNVRHIRGGVLRYRD